MGNKKLDADKHKVTRIEGKKTWSVQISESIDITSAKETELSVIVNVAVKIAVEEESQTRHENRQGMDHK